MLHIKLYDNNYFDCFNRSFRRLLTNFDKKILKYKGIKFEYAKNISIKEKITNIIFENYIILYK